jgi:hypothetical protein
MQGENTMDKIIRTKPASKNPYGWTEYGLFQRDDGSYYLAMIVNKAKQHTIDPTTPYNISKAIADQFIKGELD